MSNKLKIWWKSLGPGLITGASDDDPSAIVTYAAAGAKMGPNALWSMLYILPLMVAVQEMSARIGLASSCGLAGNIKKHYSKKILFFISFLILAANVFNIGADVFGMASAIEILVPKSTMLFAWIIVATIIGLTIFLSYKKIVMIFKWLSLSLLAYVVAGFLVIDNLPQLLKAMLLPSLEINGQNMMLVLALLGTTISPYMAFWQASEEAEEKRLGEKSSDKYFVCRYEVVEEKELKRVFKDTKIGMFFSNFIGFFIIALTGSILFNAGIHNVETIKDAAEALRPLAGDYAYILFAIGVIGSGLLAIPILAGSSAYVLSEIFDWRGSLNKTFNKAKAFYAVMIVSVLLGLIIPYLGISPIRALLWTAIAHALVTPFLIAMLIHMSNNPAIVGPNVTKKHHNLLGYGAIIAIATTALAFLGMETVFGQYASIIGMWLLPQ